MNTVELNELCIHVMQTYTFIWEWQMENDVGHIQTYRQWNEIHEASVKIHLGRLQKEQSSNTQQK
jgi:hypothetical protein